MNIKACKVNLVVTPRRDSHEYARNIRRGLQYVIVGPPMPKVRVTPGTGAYFVAVRVRGEGTPEAQGHYGIYHANVRDLANGRACAER